MVQCCEASKWAIQPHAHHIHIDLDIITSVGLQALFQGVHPMMLQYLDVRIRRAHVLQDALDQLMLRPDELKKPLKVTFISARVEEEGLDEGGVTKELFQLLIREIFNEVIHHPGSRLLCSNSSLLLRRLCVYVCVCFALASGSQTCLALTSGSKTYHIVNNISYKLSDHLSTQRCC